MSILMSVSHCWDFCVFVVSFGITKCVFQPCYFFPPMLFWPLRAPPPLLLLFCPVAILELWCYTLGQSSNPVNSHVVAQGFIIGLVESKGFSCLRSFLRNIDKSCIGGIQSKPSVQAVGLKLLIRILREPFGKKQIYNLLFAVITGYCFLVYAYVQLY